MFDNGINGPNTIINSKPVHKYHINRTVYIQAIIFTARKRSLRRLCFLQVSVCPQGGGVPAPGGVTALGGCLLSARGSLVPGECLLPGGACSQGVWSGGWVHAPGRSSLRGVPDGDSPMPPTPRTTTAAGGTHRTGMHSCFFFSDIYQFYGKIRTH